MSLQCSLLETLEPRLQLSAGLPAVAAMPTTVTPSGSVQQFASTGRNRYFILEPGRRTVLKGIEDGEHVTSVQTILNITRFIDGVETRVLRDRETHDGKLVEISRNYLAINPVTKDLFYFGEDVTTYENGHITGTGGSWRSGVNGARFGLLIPGTPRLHQKFREENAAPDAEDTGQIISTTASITTPAGAFRNCLRVKETSPLEPGAVSFKIFAPGVGTVLDDEITLAAVSG
jgi:hypothetical protein